MTSTGTAIKLPSPRQVAAMIDIMARYTTTATALVQAIARNNETVRRALAGAAASSHTIAVMTERNAALVRYFPTHKGEK